jgi:transcriptional regulator GlxA family with amidase domain
MVEDTRLKLQEIAIRTGFNSLSSFSRLFRNYYRQSPGECRKQAQPPLWSKTDAAWGLLVEDP